MHRLILAGSPRANGRTAALADELFNACIEECPEDGVSIVAVSSVAVAGCNGCDGCKREGRPPEPLKDGDPLSPCPEVAASTAALHQCIIADDMTEVRKHLDAADELVVVCPVYFAGAPSQFKALLDRLQPYFWSDLRRGEPRPCVLHLVGEGHDPYGFEPLVQSLASAVHVAGFQLELVLDWVGKITPDGEITAEAEEYPIPPQGGCAALGWDSSDEWVVLEAEEEAPEAMGAPEGAPAPQASAAQATSAAPGRDGRKGEDGGKPAKTKGRAQLNLGDGAAPKGGKKKDKGGRRG
ncbi:flavodoxin family protein [Parvibacter caecicola]|uniref:Multimeric flavodoxin WrbA n=1 Tax=Parvibacter caecicola TaxID=747645 RepID=A0A7W5CZY7_9ACTN|nr:flavodoxin family protein [Parvibacter caecicola]MBB3170349.1 multimeric flavodoxin WrbA [Parvibacter caecicola]MCR2041686.1 flavodoxin family protein [Parvibacter caecicola]RNL12245.1 hypothetical protein DMP11_01950 [Parvibacter caecicola]